MQGIQKCARERIFLLTSCVRRRILCVVKHMTLKAAREHAGLTQQELEDKSGVDRTRISRIEADPLHANPTIDTVTKLEAALRLKRGTLVFGAHSEALAS